jgi:hypothetical protein
MKKGKTGAKNCSLGANCKNTCIARAKNCAVEADKTKIKEAVIKLKVPKIKKSALSNEELTASQKKKSNRKLVGAICHCTQNRSIRASTPL